MASGPITSWKIDEETVETVRDFIFGGSKITADGECSHEVKRHLAPWKKSYDQPRQCKSLLQHHSSKESILQCSAFIIVQLSHPYMTTGKTIALTRRTFVGKVIFVLFNMLSR